ncbi:MAG: ABC transporter ATP-binding protein [Crocinitomicaceae bacterium]|nr:ABC transporter ATP-binding protein [Crocinitomicaceae bacterium]NGF76253.1 ABC transporter ATP-binding protein [Fluviicola sp. SGL-29]
MSPQKKLNIQIFFRLLTYAKAYKGLYIVAIITTVVLAFISPYRVKLIGDVVDKYVAQSQNSQLLLMWIMIIIGMLLVETVLQFLSSYYSNLLAQSVIYDIRVKLFRQISTFRMQFFDRHPIGNIVTRLISDLEAISDVFSSGLMSIMGDLLMLFITIFMMFYTDWELSLYVLVPVPILVIGTRIFARAMRKSFQLESQQVAKLNSFVQERISGMNLVQLFNRQKKEFTAFREINEGHKAAHIKAIWANSIFFPFVEMLSSLSIAFLYIITVVNLQGNSSADMTAKYGEVMVFTLWVNQLYRPIRMLADKFNILQRGTVRAERVFSLLDTESNSQNQGTSVECNFGEEIVFDNVSFAYENTDWILRDIDLRIQPGSMVAFVGATGAGKTSIVNLLGRFYDFQKGQIRIGDKDITELDLKFLRRNIAIVLQDVFLFSDTVFNNITLRDPAITKEQVIEAAKAVGAHQFIEKLPNGYDYQVGERGGVLSVGQRQLLAFIRAYVYNPQILILDEATSSVDSESELLIQQATEKLTEGRTSIVIAHRLSTIQKADKIVVLEKGCIIEEGSHKELLRQDGQYKRLFDMQFGVESNG